jgi:2-oxoglutarate dehydrogenase complex dehydrogenase (E1) component-like enzyme
MHDVDGINAGFTSALYEEYLESRDRIPAVWREFFENGAGDPVVSVDAAPESPVTPAAIAAAMSLVMAHRTHGHLMARVDPLGSEPVGDPALEPERYVPTLTPELQARIPAELLGLSVPTESLADALQWLRDTYCGRIAFEIEHIASHEERVWLRQAIESGRYRRPLPPEDKRRLLERLSRVETFERFLRRKFLGQKQFSIEGLDALVPMLDAAIERAAESGAHDVVIGMAHRGRLNVLAHVVGRPYEEILRKFEAEPALDTLPTDWEGGTDDVKYHLGGKDVRRTRAGEIEVTLLPNPSHLEAVDPVVEGFARAQQSDRSTNEGLHDPSMALPILVHGDASCAGQGVVAETFNLAGLCGYSTGGTLHLIANNQVGFTTEPSEGRSTRYPSDLAKGFDVPIVHVNADDSEAALSAVRLATGYRKQFGRDFVIDLVGYRRLGHNEQDDPSYTQPLMADRIEQHPTARELYARRLRDEGVVSVEEPDDLVDSVAEELRLAHERLQAALARKKATFGARAQRRTAPAVVTAVPAEKLRALDQELVRVPPSSPSTPSWRSSSSGAGRRSTMASCTIRPTARRMPRSSTSRGPTRRWRSSTHRSPSTQHSGSSTATPLPPPTHWSSGRRSSGTSSTARR